MTTSKNNNGVPVTDYLRSLHYGICHGPVDSINMIKVKDKIIWCGYGAGQTDIAVDLPDVFGGDKKEGGVKGVVEFYSGSATQLATEELADRTGGLPATVPAHRHYASVFFRGLLGKGFKWGTNNPYMPAVEISVTNLPTELSTDFSAVYSPQSDEYPDPVGPIHTGVFDGEVINGSLNSVPFVWDTNHWVGPIMVYDPAPQGSFLDWTVHYWINGGATPDIVSGDGFITLPSSKGGILKDFSVGEGFTDYEIDNGVVTFSVEVDFYANGFSPSNIAISVGLVSALSDGTPDPVGLTVVGSDKGTIGGEFSGEHTQVTLSVTGSLLSDTKFVRVYSNVTESHNYAVSIKVIRCDVDVKWEELVYPHCPAQSDRAAGLGTLPNANPAHMTYSLLTNSAYGKGWGPSIIDTASFLTAAETLYNEGFGLFIKWNDRSEVNKLIAEILSHIQGNVYTDMSTGLVTLKLLRDDYDVEALLHATEHNSEVKGFHRRTISETSNQIIVKWTDPVNEEQPSVRAQDMGNIAEQGGVVSTERDYYAVRSAQLAQILAERDLTSMSALLASFTVHGSREFRKVNSGDVIKVDSLDDDVIELVARVNKVTRGGSGDLPIVMECVEDVFGMESAQYVQQPLTGWRPADNNPVAFTNVEIQTAPYALMSRVGVDPDTEYPRVVGMIAAEKPNNVTIGFDLFAPTVDATGNATVTNRGENNPTDYGELSTAWVRSATTVVPSAFFSNFSGSEGPEVGSLAILGTGETSSELVLFRSFDSIRGEWTVSRGMLDTVPREWVIGTPIWFVNGNFTAYDVYDMSVNETIDYQLRSSTTSKNLSLFNTPIVPYTWSDRASLPFRPANVKVNSIEWSETEVHHNDVSITWATRDRTSEDLVLVRWDEGDVTPEAGQTAVVTLKDTGGTVLATYPGVTSPYVITEATLQALATENIVAHVSAENGGLTSLQASIHGIHMYQYPSSARWRVSVSLAGGTGQLSLAEVQLRGAVGGADLATGGTVSASSEADPAINAFDDDTATNWTVVGLTGGWIEYTFVATTVIKEVAITSRNDGSSDQGPTDFTVQYFDGSVWITVANVTGEAAWGVTETREYLV